MEENIVEQEQQGTPIWTLVKAVCKKWLIIGFCVIFGALIAGVYALSSQPLTKDVWQMSISLYQESANADKDIVYFTESNNNLTNFKEYFKSPAYKSKVYSTVKDNVFTNITDAKVKEAKFNSAVTVSVAHTVTVFVLDQAEDTAAVILSEFAKQAKTYVGSVMEELIAAAGNPADILKITAFTDEMVKGNPNESEIKGYVGTKNRLMTILMGAVIGLVAGVGIALCLYYFNNKINSSHALTAMGISAVYVDKKSKGAQSPVSEENALRYNFVIEKKGCKAVTFVSPQKTAETQKAFEAQVAALVGRGYKTLVITQDKQANGEWKGLIEKGAADNDYILIDASQGSGYDCAAPASLSDGVTLLIDQKCTKLKGMKKTREILDTAKLKILSAVVVNVKDDFVL